MKEITQKIKDRILALQSDKPLASIVIPAFNEEKYLLETIRWLSQINTQYPIEIILVDNNSNDATKKIAMSYWLKVVSEMKKWTSYARQTWLEFAKGEYIFCTDADTLVPTLWIEKSIQYFQEDTGLVFLAGPVYFEWAHWSFIYLRKILSIFRKCVNKSPPLLIFWANSIFKKDIAIKVGWYTAGMNLGEDKIIASKIWKFWKILVTTDTQIAVSTSWRRFSTFLKVYKYSMHQWPHENMFHNIHKTSKRIFSDIR